MVEEKLANQQTTDSKQNTRILKDKTQKETHLESLH